MSKSAPKYSSLYNTHTVQGTGREKWFFFNDYQTPLNDFLVRISISAERAAFDGPRNGRRGSVTVQYAEVRDGRVQEASFHTGASFCGRQDTFDLETGLSLAWERAQARVFNTLRARHGSVNAFTHRYWKDLQTQVWAEFLRRDLRDGISSNEAAAQPPPTHTTFAEALETWESNRHQAVAAAPPPKGWELTNDPAGHFKIVGDGFGRSFVYFSSSKFHPASFRESKDSEGRFSKPGLFKGLGTSQEFDSAEEARRAVLRVFPQARFARQEY